MPIPDAPASDERDKEDDDGRGEGADQEQRVRWDAFVDLDNVVSVRTPSEGNKVDDTRTHSECVLNRGVVNVELSLEALDSGGASGMSFVSFSSACLGPERARREIQRQG